MEAMLNSAMRASSRASSSVSNSFSDALMKQFDQQLQEDEQDHDEQPENGDNSKVRWRIGPDESELADETNPASGDEMQTSDSVFVESQEESPIRAQSFRAAMQSNASSVSTNNMLSPINEGNSGGIFR